MPKTLWPMHAHSGGFLPSRLEQPGITAARKNLLTKSLMPAKEGGNYVNPGSTVFPMLHTWVLATNSFFSQTGRLCLCLITDRTLLEDCLPIGAGRAIVQRWTNSRDGYALCLLRQPNIQSSHPLSHLMPSIHPYEGCTLYIVHTAQGMKNLAYLK